MNNRTHSIFPAAAVLLAFLMSGAWNIVAAQATTPPPAKMPHDGMKGMKDMPNAKGMPGKSAMSGMMEGPHHVLAMAYRDNLASFAKALRGQVTHAKAVDLDLARPAVAEMRRSFDQMKQHHQAQMATMGDAARMAMSEKTEHMDKHVAELSEHLAALESDVNAGTTDYLKVSGHASEILKLCADMSAMPSNGKAHQMKEQFHE